MTDKLALTKKMLESIATDLDFFFSHAHQDIVLEFPFGPSNGFPGRVSGLGQARTHLSAVLDALKDWRPFDVRLTPMADPDAVLVEYRASCPGRLGPYDQDYITIVRYKDDKLILFREHYDTLRFDRAWGAANA